MEIKTKYLKTTKTARYSTYGRLTKHTQFFWFVMHGSSMTCEQMLYKYKEFDPEKHFVVAPEGLSRYYFKGFGGDVVASWMTKRDRLFEIDDFSDYLTTLYQSYAEQIGASCKKIILGFSQGGTTAYRWLHHSQINVDYFIPYSCWIPEDIELSKAKTPWNTLRTFFTYGKQDQYLKVEVIEKIKKVIDCNQLKIEMLPYDGEHKISKYQLEHIIKIITKI